MIRMIDAPGFHDVEAKFIIFQTRGSVETPLEAETLVNKVSFKVFGISEQNTYFISPEWYFSLPENSPRRLQIESDYYSYEDQFQTTDMTDDQQLEYLKEIGFDFSNEQGFPLKCIRAFARQAEAAAKGIMGRMPDILEFNIHKWEQQMSKEAQAFTKKKKSA